jgi:hypothetical protein
MLTDERAAPAPPAPAGPEVEAVTAHPGKLPRSGGPGRTRLFGLTAFVVLSAGFGLDQLRALLGYGRIATNEDQTLLWFAGRELLRFNLHQPNFYGQNYNTVFEALPGQLFHLLGISLALASPLGTMLIASACWLVLAWVALRRGHQLAAAVALALPVCLSVPYLLLFDAPRGVLSGDLAGVVAVAAALTIRRPRWRLAVLLAVGGLAIAWENAVALVVLPALAATTVSSMRGLRERPWRTLLVAGAALLIPTGWLVLDHLWYRGHAVDLTAANVNTKLQLSVLATNLGHPARLFGFYAPQLWQRPVVMIAAIAVLLSLAVAVSFTVRRSAPAAAALTFLVVLLVILSARDTLDVHPDLYLSGSRFLLPMPIGLWVVLFFTLAAIRDHRCERPPGRRRLDPRLPLAAITVLALASVVSAQARFGAEVRQVTAVDAGTHPVLVVVNSTALLAECADVTRVYRNTRAQLLVTYQRNVAYGCAAQDDLNTLDTDYERRGWLLRAAATRPVRRILVQGSTCRSFSVRMGSCRPESHGTVMLTTPSRPPSVTLSMIALRGARSAIQAATTAAR